MLEFLGEVVKLLIIWTLISIPASLFIAKFLSISKRGDVQQAKPLNISRKTVRAYRTKPFVGE